MRWFQQMHVQNHFKCPTAREKLFAKVKVNFIDLSDFPKGQIVAGFQEVFQFLIEALELQLRQYLLNKNKYMTSF